MHARRLLLERKRFDEASNLGIAAHHFGELVRKVPVDLLDEVEHQIAALVIGVLLFVQDLQTDNQNASQKWNQVFVSLSIDHIEAAEHGEIFFKVLSQRQILYEHWKNLLHWN